MSYGTANVYYDKNIEQDLDENYMEDTPPDEYQFLHYQKNMLEDTARTGIYYQAIMKHQEYFKNKVVLDIGAGSGILSIFSAMAGAKKVYAVEASDIYPRTQELIDSNNLGDIIEVYHGKMEEIDLPEKVDVIVSEWIGQALFHEGMFECVAKARDKYLKPGGTMFPSEGNIYLALYSESEFWYQKQTDFWKNTDFYGVNLTSMYPYALDEIPEEKLIVQKAKEENITSNVLKFHYDFNTLTIQDLKNLNFPLDFTMTKNSNTSSLCIWFDISFPGGEVLSTSPKDKTTHWWQSFVCLEDFQTMKQDEHITGNLLMYHDTSESYQFELELETQQDVIKASAASYDFIFLHQ